MILILSFCTQLLVRYTTISSNNSFIHNVMKQHQAQCPLPSSDNALHQMCGAEICRIKAKEKSAEIDEVCFLKELSKLRTKRRSYFHTE